jgi:signal transduction histidine kinase/ActR/RegA family two-component response regulator
MRAVQRLTLSLRHLLILLTAVGLLPLAVVGGLSLQAAADYQGREQERAALDLARALSGTVDAELDGAVATLSSMSRAPAMARGDIRAFYEIARAQGAAQPAWLGVMLADAAGQTLLRTTAPWGAAPTPLADPASLAQALALRRPVVGQVARGKGGRLAFPVRIPLYDEGGRLYVLSAVIRPDRILQALGRQGLPPGALVTVLDSAGTPVARAGAAASAAASAARTAPATARLDAVGGPPEQVGASTAGDIPGVQARTRLSRYGWTVAVALPRPAPAAAFASYGAGIAASLALSILVATLLAARIVDRFGRLQHETAALGTGQPVAAVVSRVREIHAMGQSLEAAAAQQALHARERAGLLASLEQAGRAKDEFLAVLGHELRNPLSPIAAALDLMDLRDEPANRRERAILRRQVQHLKRLVDDLLDVSRITTGKLRLDMRPVDLAMLARECAGASPQPVAVQVLTAGTPRVMGDDSRLAQVLNNLLSNAARFGSDATTIVLAREAGSIRVTVSDNGVGMRPELLARVFEPFYQAPQQLARRTGGLGLGLAIVSRIVELHGGRVAAHSAGPGQGSRFDVLLPAAPAAPLMANAEDGQRMMTAPQARRVLLVDDNEDAAAATAALLERNGHIVCVAHSAQAALAASHSFKPEVAILDIGLPDMDGHALAAALRAQGAQAGTGAGSGLRLVALSGYGQRTDVERALAAGFDEHLTKPAAFEDLQRAVSVQTAFANQ